MAERFSTATRLRALGSQAAARVYRAQSRRLRRPPRRSRLTGRAALLALVVCGLVVALAYPLRQYVSQRADIADQRSELERAREEVRELRDLKARWQDPAFVERQARERLHYVRPGETAYIVPGAGSGAGAPGLGDDTDAAEQPWYDNLWDGVDRADQSG
ncbi:septum formation initiator family protein [Streptomyces sp. 7-21]|uniref:FtsB family cell division protein n=1 Tax=Streptomyces sp. 7-21 TaxID=2802283 RepID=UPI00191E3F2B|nr:septum formation initiator family protein [Streptomyces sp. 7-21]MBL1066208.1 septum formation initiator family protein [Streptomyces sp. 7-21]